MKHQITTVAVALATSLIAYAEPPEGKGKGRQGDRKGPRPLPKEIVEKFDKDGDGTLNQEERKAAFEARKTEMLAKYDKDGDGQLSEEERKAAAADRKAAAIKRFDNDGDGQLSDDEKKAMREEMRKRRGSKGGPRGKGGKGKKAPAGE